MSSVKTLVGYNRNNFLNIATRVDTLGTSLVAANGEILVLPAGWSIIEIQMKKASTVPLGGSASSIILYLLEGNTQIGPIMTVNKSVLNTQTHVIMVGTKESPIVVGKASFNDRFIMVKTDTGDLGEPETGQSVKAIIKIARDADQSVQVQMLIL